MTSTSTSLVETDLDGDELNGTNNVLFDVIWFVQECKTNNRRLTGFIKDAEKAKDADLIKFFNDQQANNKASLVEAKAKAKARGVKGVKGV